MESRIYINPDLYLCSHLRVLSSQFLYSIFGPFESVLFNQVVAVLLQSCPTLCDPIDGSLPGFSVPGILQARTLEWVAISFYNAQKWKMKVKSLSHIRLLATPWTAAYQAPPSMGFSGQQYWSGVPLPSPFNQVGQPYFISFTVYWYCLIRLGVKGEKRTLPSVFQPHRITFSSLLYYVVSQHCSYSLPCLRLSCFVDIIFPFPSSSNETQFYVVWSLQCPELLLWLPLSQIIIGKL